MLKAICISRQDVKGVVEEIMNKRFFTRKQKLALFWEVDGKCSECHKPLGDGWQAHHVEEWHKGGATDVLNGKALCQDCHRKLGGKNAF